MSTRVSACEHAVTHFTAACSYTQTINLPRALSRTLQHRRPTYKQMDVLLHNVALDLATCDGIERNLRGRSGSKAGPRRDAPTRDLREVVQECVQACRKSRKRHHEENGPEPDLSDAALSQYTRFTDHNALHVYRQFLWYTPRLVNVVTLAEAIPMPGSGISLPLDLGLIASRCKGSYYAPKRFAVRLPWFTSGCTSVC